MSDPNPGDETHRGENGSEKLKRQLEEAERLLQNMSPEEMEEEAERLVADPEFQRMVEAYKGRIYVTFTQHVLESPIDAQGVSRPAQVTFGPFIDVEICPSHDAVVRAVVTDPDTEE